MDIYRELILDHYKNPRNFGRLKIPDATVEEGNVTCGDRVSMDIKCTPDRKEIKDIRFSGEGCAISQASASLLTQKVKGMSVSDVMELGAKDIMQMLGIELTPSRVRCALLSLEVLHKGITKIRTK